MKEKRPSPEFLLQQVQEEEQKERRGKLKIYLGAAPGVGKTYTMLQDAIEKRQKGVDVVAGVLETHGRREIEAMLNNVAVLPKLKVDYHGKELFEFDLDGALKRNPVLILMDEMAHANVPGLRHNKRWQDIKELLDRGIDVYTTLNVQHIESVNDIVTRIIQVPIKETVPDFMIDLADTIELVDLPPEDLLKRLEEGKVYFPFQAEMARENFFKKGNLIALRELALQVTSARVTTQALLYRRSAGISEVWPIKEKILVCVGSRYASIKLIRVAKRLASLMQAELLAIHVDTPRVRLSEAEQAVAMQNLNFAEKEGAKTKILSGVDIVNEIMQYARAQNVTMIVVWKQVRPRWKELFFRSLADEILRHSGEIDVHVVTGHESGSLDSKESLSPLNEKPMDWKPYGIAFIVVAGMTLINFLLYPYVEKNNLIMIYLLGVMMVAFYGNLKASILSSILSVLLFASIFVSPPIRFMLSDLQYFLTLGVMLLIAYVISHLITLSKRQATIAKKAEQNASMLNALMQNLVSTRGRDERLKNSLRYVSDIFKAGILALMPHEGRLQVSSSYKASEKMHEKEKAVAGWVFEMGQMAGLGTDTLPAAEALYVPLRGSKGPIGVIALDPIAPKSMFTLEEIRLLNACANQIALSLEVDRLEAAGKRAEFKAAANRLRTVLLQAVSQDLHEPLMSAMKLTRELISAKGLTSENVNDIGNNIYLDLDQLRHLITNILHIAYTEPEQLKLRVQHYSFKEILQEALKSMERKLKSKSVLVDIPSTLPSIPLDKSLIKEVLLNLIDNAIKFTPIETSVEISVMMQKNKVVVSVEDRGPGIEAEEMEKLFDKFYRGQASTSERGLGLGLAICRNVVNAHGGEIWAENRKGGGAAFRFSLPLK